MRELQIAEQFVDIKEMRKLSKSKKCSAGKDLHYGYKTSKTGDKGLNRSIPCEGLIWRIPDPGHTPETNSPYGGTGYWKDADYGTDRQGM